LSPGYILVDTSVWIDFLSARPGPGGAQLQRLIADAAPLAFTGIILTEVLQGLARDVEKIEGYLAQWDLLEPKGLATYRRAAELFRLARSRGLTLSTVDVLIAALALDYNATLFSLDKDFVRLAKIVPLETYRAR